MNKNHKTKNHQGKQHNYLCKYCWVVCVYLFTPIILILFFDKVFTPLLQDFMSSVRIEKIVISNSEYARNNIVYTQSLEEGEEAEDIIDHSLPFLRWLISNVALKNDSILIKLSNYVRRMIVISAGSAMLSRPRRIYDRFFETLEDAEKLRDLEDFFNSMGIECKLILKKLPDDQRELYFSHEKLVPFFETASSGTIALFNLYRRLIPSLWEPSLIYLDEFDAFYHYEMAENVVKFFKKKYPKCQIIMTSHNTNLMTNRLMRPDCLFILSRTGTLTALCNATERELREGHNLEKMYISGEFEQYE